MILDEMMSDLNVLGPVMKYWILREFHATLIIAVDHSWLQLRVK